MGHPLKLGYHGLCEACGIWHEVTLSASDAKSRMLDPTMKVSARCVVCGNGLVRTTAPGS